MRVAVVGATGTVGRAILRLLEERRFPLDDVAAFASARSEGKRIAFRGGEVGVRGVHDRWFEGVDLALTSAGAAVARELLPPPAGAGTGWVGNPFALCLE